MVIPGLGSNIRIRRGKPDDALAIGTVHVEAWRYAYSRLLPESVIESLTVVRREA
jgi:hypothetical protein